MSEPPPGHRPAAPRSRRGGRRQRRLRRAVVTVSLIAAVAALAIYLAWRATRPGTRLPGEELPEITRKLSRNLPAEAPEPRFTDVTAEAGLGDFRAFRGARTSQLPEDMGPGAAWGDFDDDGDDDLFVVSAGGALTLAPEERERSRLYENLGDGTFREVEGFPETRIFGMGAAWADYDGDGRLDLAVSGYGTLLLFRNEGDRFVRDEALPDLPGFWAGLAWGDFDNDRDPDLYVSGYVDYVEDAGGSRRSSEQYGATVPYTLNPASFEPIPNLLFVNDGAGGFEEMATLFGISNPAGRSLGALWHDFDDDGRLDLYVANDISDNALYLNRTDTFADAGLSAWVADYRGAMGLAAGDWNRDGDDDLFVTHWMAQENALYDSRLVDVRSGGAAPAGVPLTFSDLAAPLGLGQIALQVVGWGTEFADLDADGWLDLVVVNGSTLETGDEPKRLVPQPPMLLWNQRGEYFHDLAPLAETLAAPRVGRGLALSDYDGDGDVDLLIVELDSGGSDGGKDGGVRLLRNDMERGHALQLRLRDRRTGEGAAAGHGEGAVVTVTSGEVALRRTVGGASYLSQSSRVLHFGLGEATGADSVEVRWPGGGTQRFGELAADAVWELTEGDPTPRRVGVASADAAATVGPAGAAPIDRQKVVEFWKAQRAAMDAMKIDGDLERAADLFRQALLLDPDHEDSRYYLANCLAALGRPEEGLEELDRMRRLHPGSHRAHKQWGVLRAVTARSPEDLAAATEALERSLEINREETGSLLVLGEIALLEGDLDLADQRFEWATRTNHRAVGGFFLRGYVAHRRGDRSTARSMLEAALVASGEEWIPEGAVAEGDVTQLMHREVSPLSRFWRAWSGAPDPQQAFTELEAYLDRRSPS